MAKSAQARSSAESDRDTWRVRARMVVNRAEQSDGGRPSLAQRAKRVIERWRELRGSVPRRELLAAAHQGLAEGGFADAVRDHKRGVLVLSGAVGDGKTTAAAWSAYHEQGPVVWLNAADFHGWEKGDRADQRRARRDIGKAGLVVIDDIGAPGTTERWEARSVLIVLRWVLDACNTGSTRAILTDNLGLHGFARYEGATDAKGNVNLSLGRMVDRLTQLPNRWVEVAPSKGSTSRRQQPGNFPPPATVKPHREQRAAEMLELLLCCQADAFDSRAVLELAGHVGLDGLDAIDGAIQAQHRAIDMLSASISHLAVAKQEPDDRDVATRKADLRDQFAMLWLWRHLERRAEDGDHASKELLRLALRQTAASKAGGGGQ